MAINMYLLIITLNVNGLNAPIKKPSYPMSSEWIRKHDPYIGCLQGAHLRTKDSHWLKVKGQKEKFHANEHEKETRVAIVISDKNRLQNKNHNKKQRRPLYNTKEINPIRGYNPCKHICTQYGST